MQAMAMNSEPYDARPAWTTEEWGEASARRLNWLAKRLSCRTYLEIGVCTGKTFFSVDIKYRTGVDPSFQFDHNSFHDEDRIKLLNLCSDEFFSALPADEIYDLIFLDGLHTYDQTYRDFQNALLHSHPDTVLLIDDTWPCDVFSTIRDMSSALKLRQSLTRGSDTRWHGDTYKIIPLLALFHTSYQYATIIDRGNPQTLVWRKKPSDAERPAEQFFGLEMMQPFLALENLAACDFLWFIQNHTLYHPMTEEEALAAALNVRLGREA
jgi:hypothetical protein